MKNIFSLENDVAAVIGGTGELGGLMAEALGAHGAKVAVLGRNADRGNARAQKIIDAGGEAKFFAADGLSAESLDSARGEISGWAGGSTSILVNAAGGNRPDATIPPGGDICKLPLDAWRDVFDLNLVGGALLPSQIFGQDMLDAGKGSIINIASMSGIIPLSTRRRVFGGQGCRDQSHDVARSRMGHNRRPRQRDQPWILPGGTESQTAVQRRWNLHRARRPDHRTHADGTLR